MQNVFGSYNMQGKTQNLGQELENLVLPKILYFALYH